jgi:hypothetical protein
MCNIFNQDLGSYPPPERLFSARPFSHFAVVQRACVPRPFLKYPPHQQPLTTTSAHSTDPAYFVRSFALIYSEHDSVPSLFTTCGLCNKKRKVIERQVFMPNQRSSTTNRERARDGFIRAAQTVTALSTDAHTPKLWIHNS